MERQSTSGSRRFHAWLRRLVRVEAKELPPVLWAFSYFFALLCAYYILRPLRDAMGIAGGVKNLQWLFTGTFLAMLAAVPLYGRVASRYPRRQFLPLVYLFFITNLFLFFALFRSGVTHVWVARAFFIWTSVFNLFIVSVFWSFMADLFNDAQAKRLFGFIAAGGTAGALAGPALTATLAVPLGPTNLLLFSAVALAWALFCIRRLLAWREGAGPLSVARETGSGPSPAPQQALGGGALAGLRQIARSPYLLGICLLILLFTTLSTFLYFQQAQIVRDSFSDPGRRTTVFAVLDLAANTLTLLIQLLLTGRIVQTLGLPRALALVPLLLAGGFLLLGTAPLLAVLAAVQVVRRAGNYAIMKPCREMLFVVLPREEKYKAKNVIDTVVYRSGDVLSAWAYAGLEAAGLTLSTIALLAVPLTLLWTGICYQLGRAQQARAKALEVSP